MANEFTEEMIDQVANEIADGLLGHLKTSLKEGGCSCHFCCQALEKLMNLGKSSND